MTYSRQQRRCSLGGAGDGGFVPADLYQNQKPNPTISFPTNQQYFQNPPNLFPTAFQNPSFFQFPYLLNSVLPHVIYASLNSPSAIELGVVKVQQDNAAAGGGDRGLKVSQASSQIPNCELPKSIPSAGDPSLESHQAFERVEAAVLKAKQDIAAAGENVSAWKVSQTALVALKADSWSSLGLQLQEVPALSHLLILEGKVNAFIHCFVAARRITSLYDLEVALCKNEGIERFGELDLGPLCRHPLVEHYFSVPSNLSEVFEITTEEIIDFLRTFIKNCHKMFSAEEFLDFVAQKKSTSAKEMLGVRIGSLGFHISCLREAEKSERDSIKRFYKSPKSDGQGVKGQKPVAFLQNKAQDHRSTSICKRVSAFPSAWDDFSGKHTRFECSEGDEDINDSSEDSDYSKDYCVGKNASDSWNQSTYLNNNSKRVSSCTYPSISEKMTWHGLKLEKNEQSPSLNKIAKESKGDKSSGKKRKNKENDSSSTKHLKKRKSAFLETLTRSTITKDFVAHWGEASLQYSVSEVLDMMLDYYTQNAKQKKHMEKLFSSDPALGLLNVAVASIKYALLADQNVTLQNLEFLKFSSQLSTKKMKERCQGDTVEFQMGKFILKWKEACMKHSVYEVLHLMFDFYGTNKKTKRMKKLHSSYPGIGIVLVAVTSIKHGILDSLCHMFEACAEQGNNSRSNTSMGIPENRHVQLRKKFKHSSGTDFLHLDELVSEDNEKISRKIAVLMKSIGLPALSEVVFREAISSGIGDSREKICLINWVLPYAQRYIFNLHTEIYFKLKQQGFHFLRHLKVIIVEKLYYKYTLKGNNITSKKRHKCSSLLQGFVLYALPTTDCHSIFLELSRLFFNGAVELHLANFLHMITTMAESGFTNEQIELFAVNSQRIPLVPDEEPIWILTSIEEQLQSPNNQPSNTVSTSVERSKSIPAKKPRKISNRPSTYWKTAQGYLRKKHLGSRFGPQIQLRDPSESAIQPEVQPAPIQVDEFIIEDSFESRCVSLLQDSELMKDQSSLVGSCSTAGREIISSLEAQRKDAEAATFPVPRTGLTVLPNWQKDKFCVQASDDQQFRYTGWLGEMIAHKFFKEQQEIGMVRWMNEENETGLPYDLIIEENNSREFIEVKTTRSSTKDWFEISTREWQFATQMGESFSIARVVLMGKNKASISILKNPVKLCQQSTLGLAILLPRG